MFRHILTLIAIVSAAAYAKAESAYPESFKTSYMIDTILDDGGHIYYSCDSVESNTKALLKQLGAEHISVSCTGGFDQWSHTRSPAYVTAKYTAASLIKNNATPREASVKEINLRSDDCHFLTATLDALAEDLDLNVISGPSSCSGGRAEEIFVVDVLSFDE